MAEQANANGGRPLNVLAFGAHPDDCDVRCSGMAMRYRALGHRVKFVSMTNGDTGHFAIGGGALAKRRFAEAQAAAAVADVQYDVWDIHNGELEVNVFYRKMVICAMREFRADIVLCHRTNDYHPDHRAVGQLVQDASYTVTVPNVCPLTPHLQRAPVVAHVWDGFTQPNPFVPTLAIDTDDIFERKVDMLHCHVSQWYEWLPYNDGILEQVPGGDAERRIWLGERMRRRFAHVADAVRETLGRCYGEERGAQVQTAEAFAISEYGRGPSAEELRELFPF